MIYEDEIPGQAVDEMVARLENDRNDGGNGADTEAPNPFQWANTQDGIANRARNDWAVRERMPLRQVTLFSGEGAPASQSLN
jgi:hypothetical protein